MIVLERGCNTRLTVFFAKGDTLPEAIHHKGRMWVPVTETPLTRVERQKYAFAYVFRRVG